MHLDISRCISMYFQLYFDVVDFKGDSESIKK